MLIADDKNASESVFLWKPFNNAGIKLYTDIGEECG